MNVCAMTVKRPEHILPKRTIMHAFVFTMVRVKIAYDINKYASFCWEDGPLFSNKVDQYL